MNPGSFNISGPTTPAVKTTVNYERVVFMSGNSASSTPYLAADSAFTKFVISSAVVSVYANRGSTLMSPTVTLHVGPAGKTFYVHEATLCKLPFFRAALNGGFAEATLRAVTLLEDDPAAVSALVEFLSTGKYTFAFHGPLFHAGRPPTIANEGSFHIGVYIVADKYDCTALALEAKRNFREVMKEVSGPHLVRAWITAYEAGMSIKGNWGTGDVYGGAIDARVLLEVKKMLEDDEDEIDRAVREVPNFGKDLLKIAVKKAFSD